MMITANHVPSSSAEHARRASHASACQSVSSRAEEMAWNCLQDCLLHQALVAQPNNLLFYPLGSTMTYRTVSYKTLLSEALQKSGAIRALHAFRSRAPILLHFDDHYDSILWFWAVLLADGIPVISSPLSNVDDHRRKHLQGLSDTLESALCITAQRLLPLFRGDGMSHGLQMHTAESVSATITANQNGYASRIDRSARKDDNTIALMMLTSGSTGNAKVVQLTHRQIFTAVAGKSSIRPLPANRPFMNWIGMDHVASIIEIHVQALYLGVDQIHVHASDVVASPTAFLDIIDKHRVSFSFAPNFFLGKLCNVLSAMERDGSWDLSSLVVITSGGEANDIDICASVSELLHKYGAPSNAIIPGFGMTETCAGAVFNLDCPALDIARGQNVVSLGKCMPGIEMRITNSIVDQNSNPNTRLAEPGEPGDLELRGPVVFRGYYNNPAATLKSFSTDGWFRTGDMARLDTKGNLILVGRVKDVINVNGIKIVSSDIQAVVEKAVAPYVAFLVCFPSRTEHSEQITVAYGPAQWPLSARERAHIDHLIIEACIMSAGPRPLVFALRPESESLVAKSSLGKVSRVKMQALFEGGSFQVDCDAHRRELALAKQLWAESHPSAPITAVQAGLIRDFANTIEASEDKVTLDTSVFDLGYTSLNLIRLKHCIETRLGISLPIITIMKNSTVASLAMEVDALLAEQGGVQEVSTTKEYDPLVVFHSSGDKQPLWLVHPGVGEVLVFVGLAQHMSTDSRPIYALRARGFEENQQPFTSIDEVVTTYLAAIRRKQPRGPYAIAGYSYGSMLAVEISKRIIADDGAGAVQFLGSFNLPPHIKSRMRQQSWNSCLLHLTQFLGLVSEEYCEKSEVEGFADIPRSNVLSAILDASDKDRLHGLGLEEAALVRWADVAYSLQSMAVNYEPSGLVDSIDVFHAKPLRMAAKSREEWLNEHLAKWKDFSVTDPIFHEVGGAHYTMIGPDHVESFATTLVDALRHRGL